MWLTKSGLTIICFQSYIGDPAQFGKKSISATWDNVFKRLTKDSAPYLNVAQDLENQTYLQVALKDRIADSKFLNSIPKEYQEFYKGIEATDAQEFTTAREHLFLLKQYGKISTDNYNNLLRKIDQELDLNNEDLRSVFQPIKPVATGKRVIYSGRNPIAEVSDYVKSSSVPLVKQFTKGLEIDKLRKKLEELESKEDKFVRASFTTANKLGNGKELDIWNNDGTINDFNISQDNYVELDRSSMGMQQEVPLKLDNKVVDGSQQRKLILSALSQGFFNNSDKILNEYNETYRSIYDQAWSNFYQEITDDKGNIDNVKFYNLLVNEAESRNWNKHDVKYFELDDNNRFKIPLFYNNLSSKIEPLLSSIINNKVLKLKRTGNSYVLRTQEGFQGFNDKTLYTDSYDGELKPARWEKDGEIVSPDTKGATFKPAQVLVPRSLFKDLNNRELKSLNPELLQSFGYRIPTNGYNTMSAMEIVGFLPTGEETGIVAPREFIVQMGSDFDVDKLNMFTYELTKDQEGNIIKDETNNNKLLDTEIQIMSNKEVYKLSVEPLTTDKLKEQIKQDQPSGIDRIYDQYFADKYNESTDGNAGYWYICNIRYILFCSI